MRTTIPIYWNDSGIEKFEDFIGRCSGRSILMLRDLSEALVSMSVRSIAQRATPTLPHLTPDS
jgi:hypothetical protein